MVRRADRETAMVRVTPRGLVPVSGYDAEILGRHAFGKVVEIELHEPRSPKQERLLRRIVGIVADNTETYPTGEALMTALKLKLGHVEAATIFLIGGGQRVDLKPKSLKDFDAAGLNEFFDRCMDVIETEVIPGFDTRSLRKESRKAVGGGR